MEWKDATTVPAGANPTFRVNHGQKKHPCGFFAEHKGQPAISVFFQVAVLQLKCGLPRCMSLSLKTRRRCNRFGVGMRRILFVVDCYSIVLQGNGPERVSRPGLPGHPGN
jgi:hypothetical protein